MKDTYSIKPRKKQGGVKDSMEEDRRRTPFVEEQLGKGLIAVVEEKKERFVEPDKHGFLEQEIIQKPVVDKPVANVKCTFPQLISADFVANNYTKSVVVPSKTPGLFCETSNGTLPWRCPRFTGLGIRTRELSDTIPRKSYETPLSRRLERIRRIRDSLNFPEDLPRIKTNSNSENSDQTMSEEGSVCLENQSFRELKNARRVRNKVSSLEISKAPTGKCARCHGDFDCADSHVGFCCPALQVLKEDRRKMYSEEVKRRNKNIKPRKRDQVNESSSKAKRSACLRDSELSNKKKKSPQTYRQAKKRLRIGKQKDSEENLSKLTGELKTFSITEELSQREVYNIIENRSNDKNNCPRQPFVRFTAFLDPLGLLYLTPGVLAFENSDYDVWSRTTNSSQDRTHVTSEPESQGN